MSRVAVRAFLALLPDRASALRMDAWRARAWPHIGHAVPVQQLHLTLCFLGEVEPRRIDELGKLLEAASPDVLASEFVADGRSLCLDTPGWRPDSRVAWLEPSQPVSAFKGLTTRLRGFAGRAGLRTDKRPLRAHVTLARGVYNPPPAPLTPPSIDVAFGPVMLMESRLGPDGPHYETLASWE